MEFSGGKNSVVITHTKPFLVQRRKIPERLYQEWDGESWKTQEEVSLPFYCERRFTDYELEKGLYIYRISEDERETWITSTLQKIGEEKVGYSFGNYVIPEGQWGEVLTPDDLRYTYLWGVDFQAGNGDIFTDAQIRFAIDSALSEMERFFHYNLRKRIVKCNPGPQDPYDLENNGHSLRFNNQIVLEEVPVLSVERCDFFSPNDYRILNLLEWMFLDKKKGVITFRPKAGSLSSSIFPYLFSYGNLPAYRHAFKIDYTVGYETAKEVPEDIRECIGKIAAMKLLNVIGDGLIAGFSSSSLSMDGVSESFSSTQSATSAYFGARIKVYQDDAAQFKKEMKNKLKRAVIGVI